MNRQQLLDAVAAVIEVLDEHLQDDGTGRVTDIPRVDRDDEALAAILGARENESLLEAAKRFYESAQVAYEEQKLYKAHASVIAQLVGTQRGGDAVEAVRQLVRQAAPSPGGIAQRVMELLWARKDENAVECAERWAKTIDEAGARMQQLDNETFLDAVDRIVADAKPDRSSDVPMMVVNAEEWQEIRKVLCARGDTETTLQAAERNRERIIELAREIDEYDRKISVALRPMEVAPGKAVEAIYKLVAENKALKVQV